MWTGLKWLSKVLWQALVTMVINSSTLKFEAGDLSETLKCTYQSMWCYIPEDCVLNIHSIASLSSLGNSL
jgi:hypothetical protein